MSIPQTQTRAPLQWQVVKVYEPVHEANARIADAIGFLYDTETGEWYNRSCQSATEEDAGYCAYHHGVAYGDMTSAGMRSGWLEASGFEQYCQAVTEVLHA